MKYPRLVRAKISSLLVVLSLGVVANGPPLRAASSVAELRAKAAATQDSTEAQKLWLELAERGDAEGQYQVGAHLRFMKGDYPGAHAWFLKAANQGHIEAMIQLGHLYTDEEPSESQLAEGLRWWKNAAAKGSDEARSQLAMMQMYGSGMPRDRVQARATLTELAAKKLDSATHYLTVLDRIEKQEKADAATEGRTAAVASLRAKAEGGDLKAMFELAEMLNTAESDEAQSKEAMKWYQQAAEKGLPEAQLTWFNIVEQGDADGTPLEAAMALLERAAKSGHAPAQFRLADYFLEHNAPGPEFQEALGWMKKAADQKYAPAMKDYGMHLAWGEYLPKDFPAALRYYRAAAEAGSDAAQRDLMEIYRDGKDRFDNEVKANTEEALRFGRMSVRKGQFTSYVDFANALLDWPNATADMKAEARKLLTEAAEQGGDDVAKARLAALDAPAAPVTETSKPAPAAPPTAAQSQQVVVAASPASSGPTREGELEKLAEEFAAFEKEMAVASTALARVNAVERFGYFLRDDLDGNAISATDSGEWALRKLIPWFERHPSESLDWINELPTTHVRNETLPSILPASVLAALKANAGRAVEEYRAREKQMDVVRANREAADRGDPKALLAIGMAYLAMPQGRVNEWADATYWLTRAAQKGAPGAAAEQSKLAGEVQARYRALAAAKDMDGVFKMNFQKAYSPMEDADKAAVMGARILLSDPLPHAGMRARITNLLDIAVKKGNVDAMVEYGRYYLGHPNVPIREENALPWFQKAAAAGNGEAKQWVALLEAKFDVAERGRRAYALGQNAIVSRSEGSSSFTDFSPARPFFRYAAAIGNPDGLAFEASMVLEKNEARAVAMFQKAAELGSSRAMSMLSDFHRHGTRVAKSPILARHWALRAAENGDGFMQYAAAWKLMSGEGGDIDLARARKYFLKGAELNHTGSMYELGVMAFEGKGTAQSDAEAFSWWKKAADLSNTDSKFRLAELYRDGRGTPKDVAAARAIFQELANNQSKRAQDALVALDGGSPAAKSGPAGKNLTQRPLAELQAAAGNGDANAMYELGQRYETGDGVGMNTDRALGWYMKAADAGHEDAGIAATELNMMMEASSAKSVAKQQSEAKRAIDAAAGQPKVTVAAPGSNATAAEKAVAARTQASLDTFFGGDTVPPATATAPEKPGTPAAPVVLGKADGLFSNAKMFAGMGLREDAQKMLLDAATYAETGSPATRHALASVIFEGSLGVPKNPARGLALLQSSADAGFVPAQFDLAQALHGGLLGLTADPDKAVTYFQKAAAGADDTIPEGKYSIGLLLVDGAPGVPADRVRAEKLLRSSAESGFGPAQFQLGRILVAGLIGVAKDTPAGLALLEKASAQNVHEATMFLAELYARGTLVPQDLFKAEKWLLEAKGDGIKEAEPWLKQVRDEINKRTAPTP